MLRGVADGAQGVLPSQLIREAIAAGYVHADGDKIPEDRVQPASLDLRLGPRAFRTAVQLPARGRDRRAARCDHSSSTSSTSARRRRARAEPALPHPAHRAARTARGHAGQDQPEELDRPPRRVHPRDHRRQLPVRRDRRRLRRPALPRGRPALVRGAGRGRALAQPAPPARRAARARPTTSCCAAAPASARCSSDGGQPVPARVSRSADGLFLEPRPARRRRGHVGYRASDNAPLLDMSASARTGSTTTGSG